MKEYCIRGRILLPAEDQIPGGVAIVGLDDVTFVDLGSTRVAEAVIEPLTEYSREIPFSFLVEGALLQPSSAYSLAAEIRSSRGDALTRADYLSTAAHPWSPDINEEFVIPVQRV